MLYKYCGLIICSLLFWQSQPAAAACTILNSNGKIAAPAADQLAQTLNSAAKCPKEVFAFRQLLNKTGLKLTPTMVANRGMHNPTQGSFSIFETVTGPQVNPGEFFFGHFTAVNFENKLVADQNPKQDALMIEALAWDPHKQYYNFYELRGNGKHGQWFYRGDSADILADNILLHLQADPQQPQFGTRLRCSACHNSGGPIMKELVEPHNDWWQPTRKLNFAGRQADQTLETILNTLVPAQHLATSVEAGLNKLLTSPGFAHKIRALSLQVQLRPLFCTTEINLQSDLIPNDEHKPYINIPADFFVDPRLLAAKPQLQIARKDYEAVLKTLGSNFPETSLTDADHAWLTPVKSTADQMAIDQLISTGVIDTKFMADVLSVDLRNPVFSATRCELLRYVPQQKTANWRGIFINNLKAAPQPAAKQLAADLQNQKLDLAHHQQQAAQFLQKYVAKLKNPQQVEKLYRLLNQRRAEVRSSEISRNPLGQILEPGFRVIFPEIKQQPTNNLAVSTEREINS